MKTSLSALFFSIIFLNALSQDTTQKVTPNRLNALAQQNKPYVILISIDAFRWDLADKYQAKNLIRLRESGVKAAYLKPSYPSLTFPNHYTIATGLYPSHHGIVDNTFYDRKKNLIYTKTDKTSEWYGGKPIWTLAEEQQLLTACFYWPGSEVTINGIKPTYLYNYSEIIPVDQRVAAVKNWLHLPEEKRPHLIAMYFPQVDKAAHDHSAESEQTKAAVQIIDDAVGKLVKVAQESGLPINFIFLSDHGMTVVERDNAILLPKAIDLNKVKVPNGNGLLHVYAYNKSDIKTTYRALKLEAKNYDVYLSKNIPKAWHYNAKNDKYDRIGDILLVPKPHQIFMINGVKPDVGQHGFDPSFKDMHATFYAWGPLFKSGITIPAFENVNVYPLIAKILGLKYTNKIDGKEKTLQGILR